MTINLDGKAAIVAGAGGGLSVALEDFSNRMLRGIGGLKGGE